MIAPSATRDRLTAETYLPKAAGEAIAALELALKATIDAEPVDHKIREAEKEGLFHGIAEANVRDIAPVALSLGVVTDEEFALLKRRNELRDAVIHVDDFPFDYGFTRQQPRVQKAAA